MPNDMHQLRTEPRTCKGSWATVSCRNEDCADKLKVHPRWVFGCDSAHCSNEECNDRWTSRRAYKARTRLAKAGNVGLAYVVLTLPEELYPMVMVKEGLSDVRRTSYAFLQEWATVAHKLAPGQRIGGLCTFHPTGDNLNTFQPHLNLVYPLRAVTTDGTGWVNLKYHVEEDDLRALCAAWTAQCRAWGYTGPAPVQVNYEFRQTGPESIHTLSYVLRAFPTWSRSITYLAWFGIYSSRNAGALPIPPDEMEVLKPPDPLICEGCGSSLCLVGFNEARGPPVKRARLTGRKVRKNFAESHEERQKYAVLAP